MKKLERSDKNKQLAGVCGGLAEYFKVDPTLVRVGYVLLTIFTGFIPGIIGYIVLILVIPSKGGKSIVEAEIIDKK